MPKRLVGPLISRIVLSIHAKHEVYSGIVGKKERVSEWDLVGVVVVPTVKRPLSGVISFV